MEKNMYFYSNKQEQGHFMGATRGENIFVPILTWVFDKFPRMTKKCCSIHEIKPNA